ncbi:MAG: hypothetical protein ACPGU1_05475 [Myxococcota bacterium]
MTQRVEYEAMPGTRYDQYIPKLRAIAGFLATPEGAKFKPFRDFLRRQGLWDKQKSVTMLSLVDLSWDRQQVYGGGLAIEMGATPSDEDAQGLLFERLRSDNILLLKYVLEALDVESGGRLHSVHELYRMVTSYVYPGDYVTLPNFQAWIEWLAATGMIKMIGIRWGLSERGLETIQEFRGLDIEEILEDMAELEASQVEEAAEVAAEAPEVYTEPEDILDGVMPAEDDADDAPGRSTEAAGPAAPRPRGGRPAPVVTSLHPQTPAVRRVSGPATSARLHEPLPVNSETTLSTVIGASADIEGLVATIIGWHEQWHGWPAMTAATLGVDTGPEGLEGDSLLAELAVLALWVEGLPVQPQLIAGARRVRQSGFFAALHGDDGFAGAMSALGDIDGEPWLRTLSERLIHAHGVLRRLKAAPGLMDRLHTAEDGRAAARLLREELFGGAGVEAPFWVMRELVREGLIDGVKFANATVVPTPRLRRNAARIGLIPRADAAAFDDLVAISAAVAGHFGADAGYGEALESMDRALGLASISP